MDIFSKKSNLKLILLLTGSFIGIATVLYTSHIANKMAKEEQYNARLWAEAIERKARLVRYTKDLFTKLAQDERQKVSIYAKSTEFVLTIDNNELLTFFNDIITSNDDIPAILVDQKGNIIGSRNIEIPVSNKFDDLPEDIRKEFSVYPPIVVNYKISKNYIYYKDSNLFSKLKHTLNDLVETFITEVVVNTASAPVILTDEQQNVIAFGNIDSLRMNNSQEVARTIGSMQNAHDPVVADLGEGVLRYIYYDDSVTLRQLRIFPYVQLAIFAAFLLLSYLAFSSARRAEQNRVWVGMAKETAHQLGTPISSLEGWVEVLREQEGLKNRQDILQELESDIHRLSLVAERFSKIGSVPQLYPENVRDTIEQNLAYMKRRASEKVTMDFACHDRYRFMVNRPLFDWVLENLLKNALDAMEGDGKIHITASEQNGFIALDVTDTGKGIPKSKFKTVFEPGYSTKKRGWGLGLSLTRRIVEDYHGGKIYVKSSEPGKGTTFRVMIPAA